VPAINSFISRDKAAINKPVESFAAAIPQGKNAAIPNVANRKSFIIPAHSINARCLPEYSSIIPSWIIVSSRWVAGLSTGILPVSARAIRTNDSRAKAREGLSISGPCAITCTIWERDVDLHTRDTVNMAISMAGSAIDAMVFSRLAPIPPKAVPMSIPARAVKNLAIVNRDIRAIMSAVAERGRSTDSMGIIPPARTAEPKTTYGVNLNIHDAFSARTMSLWKSFIRSRYGCNTPAVVLP